MKIIHWQFQTPSINLEINSDIECPECFEQRQCPQTGKWRACQGHHSKSDYTNLNVCLKKSIALLSGLSVMNGKRAAEGRQLRFQPFLPPVTLGYLFKLQEPLLPCQQLGIIIPTERVARVRSGDYEAVCTGEACGCVV